MPKIQRLHFTKQINAPRQKVWETMLGDETYRDWTSVFNPPEMDIHDSRFEGQWTQGSDISFVSTDKDGKDSGMYATIKESRPFEYLSIQHLGEVRDGAKMPWPEENGEKMEMFENYKFTEKDGGTQLDVELDTVDQYKDMFAEMWPKSLDRLKELAEQ